MFNASVWMMPRISFLALMTGKFVKPDLYNLSRTRGPKISFSFTKIILSFGAIRSPTVRLSKFMMAAIRLRSLVVRMSLGVRLMRSIKSGRVLGVYFVGDFEGRYFSNFGSIIFVNFRINSSNML